MSVFCTSAFEIVLKAPLNFCQPTNRQEHVITACMVVQAVV